MEENSCNPMTELEKVVEEFIYDNGFQRLSTPYSSDHITFVENKLKKGITDIAKRYSLAMVGENREHTKACSEGGGFKDCDNCYFNASKDEIRARINE